MRKIDIEIIEKINADDSIKSQTIEELRTEYDTERTKKKPDYALLGELSMLIAQKEGADLNSIDVSEQMAKIKQKAEIRRKSIIKRCSAAVCASVVLILGLNTYSVYSMDMNIFSAVIELTKGGFSVDFRKNEPEPVELTTSANDPYGFIAKLAEYDIEFETPHYIPEGFILTEVETNVNESFADEVCFIFEDDKKNFSFSYIKYHTEIPKAIIPSDHYNISETKVNGTPAIVSKEDNQYTIMYINGKIKFTMFSIDVPYEECEKIVNSIK